MKRKKIFYLFICLLVGQQFAVSQNKPQITFGLISPADFKINADKLDSGANAVIISDIGETKFESSSRTSVFKRFMRVKILNKNGFDIATQSINLFWRDQWIVSIKGSTFNMENGQIVETKLDEKSIYDEKLSDYYTAKKIALPSLKEGSIFDLEYVVRSSYSITRSWNFQGKYPCLWSEYNFSVPSYLHFFVFLEGKNNFDVKTVKPDKTGNGHSSTEYQWIKKDVPGIKTEPYVTTTNNQISRVTFQLHYFQVNDLSERINFDDNWSVVSKKLLEDQYFGQALNANNHWMKEEMSGLKDTAINEVNAKKIYNFVRNNFTCKNNNSIYSSGNLKDVFRNRTGNSADLNLLLTAMFRHEGFDADPVILSTREHGKPFQGYPLLSQYNYVVCQLRIGDKSYCLDACHRFGGYGYLIRDCYNGDARIINEQRPYVAEISPDSVIESEVSNVFVGLDENGKISGTINSTFGKNSSYDIREAIDKKSEKTYKNEISSGLESGWKLQNFSIDSLSNCDYPITIHYDVESPDSGKPQIIYINPIFAGKISMNPFKSAHRQFPVEMTNLLDETYIFNLEIPKNYTVDEMPKSVRYMLNQNDGVFEYVIEKGEISIQMQVRLVLNKADFSTGDYDALRNFYGMIVSKENEQIVLKKIN